MEGLKLAKIASRNRGNTEMVKTAWNCIGFLKTEFKWCFLIWYFYLLCIIVILLLTLLTTYLLVCLLQGIGLQSTVLDIGYANSVMFCKIHKAIIQETSTKNQHFPKCFVRSFIWLILFACLDKIRVDSPCKSTCETAWNGQIVNMDEHLYSQWWEAILFLWNVCRQCLWGHWVLKPDLFCRSLVEYMLICLPAPSHVMLFFNPLWSPIL